MISSNYEVRGLYCRIVRVFPDISSLSIRRRSTTPAMCTLNIAVEQDRRPFSDPRLHRLQARLFYRRGASYSNYLECHSPVPCAPTIASACCARYGRDAPSTHPPDCINYRRTPLLVCEVVGRTFVCTVRFLH